MIVCSICSTKDGVRLDSDGIPMWHKMEGCPRCDKQIYTPDFNQDELEALKKNKKKGEKR